MNVSSGSTLTQPPLRASWLWLLPVTWRATVPRWDVLWKYPKCHKRTWAPGNAVYTAQKADWEQWSMICRSQVPSPMGLLLTLLSSLVPFPLSTSPCPSSLGPPGSHLLVILSQLSPVPHVAPSSSPHSFPFCLLFCSPSLSPVQNQPSLPS